MAVIWSAGVPACLLASHRFEGILSPAASVNLMDPEQHRKGVESTCSCLDKRLYEAFIDPAEEIAESHSWIRDLLFTRLCDILQASSQVVCRTVVLFSWKENIKDTHWPLFL